MVDVEGGNDMLFLPLDRLAQSGTGTGGTMDSAELRRLIDEALNDRAQ